MDNKFPIALLHRKDVLLSTLGVPHYNNLPLEILSISISYSSVDTKELFATSSAAHYSDAAAALEARGNATESASQENEASLKESSCCSYCKEEELEIRSTPTAEVAMQVEELANQSLSASVLQH